MRRVLAFAFLASCAAHGPRPIQPDLWHELVTEHFVLRTDLALEEARRTAVDLEEVRAALLAAGWHTCKYDPLLLEDGKPAEVRWQVELEIAR